MDNGCNHIESLSIYNAVYANLTTLDNALRFLAPTLTKLTLSVVPGRLSYEGVDEDILLNLVLDTCTQLTTLVVSGTVLFSNNFNTASTKPTSLKNLCLQADFIGRLDLVLARCPQLVFLQVVERHMPEDGHDVIEIIAEHCPNIKYLHCYVGEGQIMETRYQFANDQDTEIVTGMKELAFLRAKGDIIAMLQRSLNTLETLVISKRMIMLSPKIVDLIPQMKTLERLDIRGGGSQTLTRDQWISIWKGCINVTSLTVRRCLLTDEVLMELVQYCKRLERLDLRFFSHERTSNEAIKNLVDRIPTLKYLKCWERRGVMPLEGKIIDEILASRGGYLERH